MKTLPLTKGQVALVDDCDYERLSKYKWSALKTKWGFYAIRGFRKDGKQHFVFMHRDIMEATKGIQVDHRNRIGTDNQRHNLRLATQAQNNANMGICKTNTSGFKGVGWHKSANKWKASLSHNNKSIYLGVFVDRKDAAAAYDSAAIRLRGEFASTNQSLKT